MAVGARRKDILSQFLIEALAITLLSAILGIVLGVSVAYSIGIFGGWRTHITVDSIALAAGSAALVGVLFGLYPACKAARLSPIDALGKE
jgi:ABC-type antimicrobial peptide transport system permease subunit